MASEYETAHAKYRELAKLAASGDSAEARKAKADKAKVMNDIRAIERDAARAGTRLNAVYRNDRIEVQKEEGAMRSKRSLQEEYVGKFASKDGQPEPEVKGLSLNGNPVKTLREYHSKRLLGK
jgi:hypothetical protein